VHGRSARLLGIAMRLPGVPAGLPVPWCCLGRAVYDL